MKRAVIIRTGGDIETVDISGDELTHLQKAVGGLVQAIDLSPTLTMWLNDEGKIIGLPHNALAQNHWDSAFGVGTDVVVGDVMLTGGVDHQGEIVGLTDSAIENLNSTVNA